MAAPGDGEDMGKEDRRRVVLEFLVEHDLALPPRTIYRNLRWKHNITFSYSSVDNYLDEFTDEGLVKRVEPQALAAREVVEMDKGKHNRSYYVVTEKGRDYLFD